MFKKKKKSKNKMWIKLAFLKEKEKRRKKRKKPKRFQAKEHKELKDKGNDNKIEEKEKEKKKPEINDDDKKEIKIEDQNINEEVDNGNNENVEIEVKNDNKLEEKKSITEEAEKVDNKVEENEKIESEKIEKKNTEKDDDKDIEEPEENIQEGNLNFDINENLIKIINDETLDEDTLFSKIMPEVKISSKNTDDIGIYIYIHFLFRNSYHLFMEENINRDENNNQTLSDYLDDKITSFNFDKFMSYIKDEKIALKNKKRGKDEKSPNFVIFEFIKKDVDEDDINADLCFQKNKEINNYKLLVNYDLIKDSMYSKG